MQLEFDVVAAVILLFLIIGAYFKLKHDGENNSKGIVVNAKRIDELSRKQAEDHQALISSQESKSTAVWAAMKEMNATMFNVGKDVAKVDGKIELLTKILEKK